MKKRNILVFILMFAFFGCGTEDTEDNQKKGEIIISVNLFNQDSNAVATASWKDLNNVEAMTLEEIAILTSNFTKIVFAEISNSNGNSHKAFCILTNDSCKIKFTGKGEHEIYFGASTGKGFPKEDDHPIYTKKITVDLKGDSHTETSVQLDMQATQYFVFKIVSSVDLFLINQGGKIATLHETNGTSYIGSTSVGLNCLNNYFGHKPKCNSVHFNEKNHLYAIVKLPVSKDYIFDSLKIDGVDSFQITPQKINFFDMLKDEVINIRVH